MPLLVCQWECSEALRAGGAAAERARAVHGFVCCVCGNPWPHSVYSNTTINDHALFTHFENQERLSSVCDTTKNPKNKNNIRGRDSRSKPQAQCWHPTLPPAWGVPHGRHLRSACARAPHMLPCAPRARRACPSQRHSPCRPPQSRRHHE